MDQKKLLKWLKGVNAGRVVAFVFLIPAVLLLFIGGVTTADAAKAEPVRFEPRAQEDDYCYMDVQYMTELFATLEEDGIDTAHYCYAADEDFNWVCLQLEKDEYAQFAEIVDFTYDFEDDTAPDTIRIIGSLYSMERDLADISEEYYNEYIAYDESDVFSHLFIRYGSNEELYSALAPLVMGGTFGLIGVLLMCSGNKRGKTAKKTMESIITSGQFEAITADLESPDALKVTIAREKSGGNVLGDKYVFVFTSGRILTYDELEGISFSVVRNDLVASLRTLNLIDADGKTLPFFSESIAKAGQPDCVIDRIIAHIQQRNPGCNVI